MEAKFGPKKKFFINKKLSENFIDLSFIRNLGVLQKSVKKMAQKILVKILPSQIFMASKIFIDTIFRGKIL